MRFFTRIFGTCTDTDNVVKVPLSLWEETSIEKLNTQEAYIVVDNENALDGDKSFSVDVNGLVCTAWCTRICTNHVIKHYVYVMDQAPIGLDSSEEAVDCTWLEESALDAYLRSVTANRLGSGRAVRIREDAWLYFVDICGMQPHSPIRIDRTLRITRKDILKGKEDFESMRIFTPAQVLGRANRKNKKKAAALGTRAVYAAEHEQVLRCVLSEFDFVLRWDAKAKGVARFLDRVITVVTIERSLRGLSNEAFAAGPKSFKHTREQFLADAKKRWGKSENAELALKLYAEMLDRIVLEKES